MASSNASPAPPLLAERYQLERRLAQGGMAEVWLATDLLLTRAVAVKVLKEALAADPVVAERFRREAVAVAGLNHPNIVAIYDTVDEGGRQAVVMQYVPGKSLRQLLDEDNTLSPEMTIRIGQSVAAALENAHRAGLVHRDVKPGNILVTPEGRVLLTDFGIAKALEGETDLTSENIMMGTAKYLSPEQVRGRKLDGRADLYSLGLVLYECLVGRVPFLGDNDAATALARLQRDPTPISRLRPTLPAGLPELIHRLLARNPDERPASGAVVQSYLSRIRSVGEDPTSPTPVPAGVRPAIQAVPSLPNSRGTARDIAPGRGRDPRPSGTVVQTPPAGVAPHRTSSSRPVARRDSTPTTPLAPGEPTGRQRLTSPSTRPPARPRRGGGSLVLGGTLAVMAVVITVAIWASSRTDDPVASGLGPTDSVTTVADDLTAESTGAVVAGPATIANVVSYDPDGEDLTELPELVPNAIDGSEGTSWQTVCYSNKYMGGKAGVGLVVELSSPATGSMDLTFGAKPWAVQIYAADSIPASVAEWGAPVDKRFSTEKLSATFDLGAVPHTHILILLTELAPDPGCSANVPFRGRISEISITPT